jgi:signal transduction histidine kinase
MVLQEGGVLFNARLLQPAGELPFDLPQKGSRLRLAGIVRVQDVTEASAIIASESFLILLRSAFDVAVVQKPPWLTPQRVAWLLPTVSIVFLACLGGVIFRSRLRLRAHHHERAAAEARLLAIMAERNRLAREIHDTLAQGYTAVSAQLEILKGKVARLPDAAKHLELARGFVRNSLAEARRSIWEMRSQALEEADLPAALSKLARQLTTGTAMTTGVQIKGTPRRLAVVVENNLLRIGQEAITNAVKYARPTTITVLLNYQSTSLELCVRDDGCGFDDSKITVSQEGGFGLVDMKERAQQIGGSLFVKSELGSGTEIRVEVPSG